MDGSTIGTNTAQNGGGIFNDSGTATIQNSASITGNSATFSGGGIFNDAMLIVDGSTLGTNTALYGGAIFNRGTATIQGATTIMANSVSQDGGGIYSLVGGTVTVDASTLTGNSAGKDGGGVFNDGSFTGTNSTFNANTAGGEGGGIGNTGTLILTNVTISGNSAVTNGGGIYTGAVTATAQINNSTIANNRADSGGTSAGTGGGISHEDPGSVTLTSTIVATNFVGTGTTGSDVNGTVSGTFNLIGVDTGLSGLTNGMDNNLVGTAASPIDPLLEPLADNGGPTRTQAILPSSPALNAGDNPLSLDFDQRGTPFVRTFGNQTDIGALELHTADIAAYAPGPGTLGIVQVVNAITQDVLFSFEPYPGFMGGVRVAVGDVNNDGTPDIITGAGPGGGPHVKVIDGNTHLDLYSFFAYNPAFLGGVFVAAADVNGDNLADIIVGADAGGGPHVKVFSGANLSELFSFFAYDPRFAGGVRVAAGDITGDGTPDIITAPGPGGGPHVRVFDGSVPQTSGLGMDISATQGNPLGSFFAYNPAFLGGVFVAAGDVNGDGQIDLITGAGPGGGPHVRVFSERIGGPSFIFAIGSDGAAQAIYSFFAYNPAFLGGVRVAASDITGDGQADIITAPGPGGGPNIRAFDAADPHMRLAQVRNVLYPNDPNFHGGVFVAASTRLESLLALRLADGFAPTENASSLTQSEAEAVFAAALARLEAAGLSADAAGTLSTLTIEIQNLAGNLLGGALPGAIVLDTNAAGLGWYIDPTPLSDEEFPGDNLTALTSPAAGHVDLLTVLLHELAHQLGGTDLDAGEFPNRLLADSLPPGQRRLPNSEDLDNLFANGDVLNELLN